MRETRSGGGGVGGSGAGVWDDGGDDVCDVCGRKGSGEGEGGADWAADREHANLHCGWGDGSGGSGDGGRDLCGREGSGAWVWEGSGADGGAVCAGPVCGRRGSADVPDWGPRTVAGRWEGGVCRPERRAGEDPRISDRVGGSGSSVAGAGGGEGSGGGGAGGGGRRQEAGGVLHGERRRSRGRSRGSWGKRGTAAGIYEPEPAGVHGAGGVCAFGEGAVDPQWEGGSEGVAEAGGGSICGAQV